MIRRRTHINGLMRCLRIGFLLAGGWIVETVVVRVAVDSARGLAALSARSTDVAAAVSSLAGCLLAVCVTWLLGSAVLMLVGELPGRRVRWAESAGRRLAPGAWRRCVLAGAGFAVVASTTATTTAAHADPWSPPDVGHHQVSRTDVTDALVGLPVPDRPSSAPPRSLPEPEPRINVVVQPGDSLWTVAAGRLGADASDAAIADEWHRWYHANRDHLGPDPDLITPGQILRPPTA